MRVVLAHVGDASARYVFDFIRQRVRDLEYVSVESLSSPGTRWHQELGGRNVVSVGLRDGRTLESGAVTAVLNRLLEPPRAPWVAGEDHDYARSELTAFAASWVRRLGRRVFNEPTPQGLCGRWRTALSWRSLAASAGLSVEEQKLDSETVSVAWPPVVGPPPAANPRMFLVVQGVTYPSVPADVATAVAALAERAETEILGIRFATPPEGHWCFLDATPFPDLTAGGDAGIAAISELLVAQ